jgi:Domain of unknown function (DUF4399)/Family of unknown function (DUF6130)
MRANNELVRWLRRVSIASITVAALATAIMVSACGGAPEPPAQQQAPAAAPASTPPAASAAAQRVFFVEPKDGATVKSPVHLVFGIEGYQLAPVPQGTITPAEVRPGVGHHHVGVDQDCLPAGTEIVKGTPSWVHFGTGATFIDMQLTPGPHKLSLQLGDDLHRTVDNLCQTINVTVTP